MAKLIYSAITFLDGEKAFPDDFFVNLDLLSERLFRNGTVYPQCRIKSA